MEIGTEMRKGVSSLYEDQLHSGFESLRFGDFLEDEFRQDYLEANFQKSRLVIGLSLIVVIGVTLVDMFASTDASRFMGKFGFTLMTPMLLFTLISSYIGHRLVYQTLLALSALVIGVAGSVVDVQASLAGQGYYFAGQVGWIFMIWSLLGLLFSAAAALCALVSLIYLGLAAYVGLPSEQLFFEGFMLLNINLLGGYSCYKIEFAARRTYLESRILNQRAERDGLTGLYKRRTFDEYIERIWRQSRREQSHLIIMLIDIDHFKPYNDLYGHQAGDDALKQVAEVIADSVQRPLDMAARYGGEEFALVLYGAESDYSSDFPERLRQRVLDLGTVHEAATHTKFLSISIGVAVVNPDTRRSLAGAIQMADEALYQAKEEGRNRLVIKQSGTTEIETGRFRARAAS
ncbi:MAG: diguanylate cyclase [Gammaproteobacteria bacterium]|jgi:diguanylate cyclase (GGDEF)-like protein|nr:diguanylate cyclase [Gammaproteobacteria bacterium]MDP7094009.1 diguanylate cyclase [Gammaproteobacteria bacterium]MDP7271129.1 diguanylate cyclase [Gammaproteobacteria bacterium]HJP03983.1 diguanylate cyclase [Gammaproteobacteria bacterium]